MPASVSTGGSAINARSAEVPDVKKAKCEETKICPPKPCYASKVGRCLILNKKVMPYYMSHVTTEHNEKGAFAEFSKGSKFYKPCTRGSAEDYASKQVIAGS